MDLFEKVKSLDFVNEYKKQGIYPYFHYLQSQQDKEVTMEGKRIIMLGSNNYLGLTSDDSVKEAGIKAIQKYGTGCSGSRFLNGTLDLHLELEKELADFLVKEAVCTWSTGFQSNLGIISSIVGHNDVAICDRENHASIYDGIKLSYGSIARYRHSDMDSLRATLSKLPEDCGKLIVTDGVFSMSGDIAKLDEIYSIAKDFDAKILVDDSHAIGVIGKGGRGTASYFGMNEEIDLIMGTFSKSFASLGGFCAGNERIINYIMHSSRPYIFSASMPPANTASALAALRKLKAEPERVQNLSELSKYFKEALMQRMLKIKNSQIPIVPIYTSDAITTLKIARDLFNEGVYVNPVLPPAAPEHECLIRTSLMATLTKELLDEAADKIAMVISRYIDLN